MTDPAAPEPPARAALVPDVPVALGKLVRRVLCGNPGMMTGPGTNTYLVGIDEVAVIDPGPHDDAHLDAVAGRQQSASAGSSAPTPTATTRPAPPGEGAHRRRILSFEDRDGLVCDRHLVDGDTVEAPSSPCGPCTPPATPPATSASCSGGASCSPATT